MQRAPRITHRNGEQQQTWFRTDRFFVVDGDWYFSTREGHDIGPYGTRKLAESGLKVYIKCMQSPEPNVFWASEMAKKGLWATTLYH
ncbi:DUF6316 family protein [Teredinibacter sp. KSP-S5-2]|uniref:DUF6316 family protein n=1 Tax=Teredinibacter sp. KSP-S5-2 TaxID=3034506 RepID=UPI0029341BAF|nr:DUF6316 family protein [Teredinibacter sp. KSP-S5-2]WNO09486.1 DUF6316 family protein [Teredinibacter sp. KSP-S5-2]